MIKKKLLSKIYKPINVWKEISTYHYEEVIYYKYGYYLFGLLIFTKNKKIIVLKNQCSNKAPVIKTD